MAPRELKELEGFEDYLIALVQEAGEFGVPQADALRSWLSLVPYSTLRLRVDRLQRQGKIRIRTIGKSNLLLPPLKREEEEAIE